MVSIKNLKPNNTIYEQAYYIPQNPHKYRGDINKIIYRSSYEKRFCQICDMDHRVVEWSSEPIAIRYTSLVDGTQHNYWIDFWFKKDDGSEYIVEVKPNMKLTKPKKPKKKTVKSQETYNKLVKEYLVNYSKFEAASNFAKQTGLKFLIVDENYLFGIR